MKILLSILVYVAFNKLSVIEIFDKIDTFLTVLECVSYLGAFNIKAIKKNVMKVVIIVIIIIAVKKGN